MKKYISAILLLFCYPILAQEYPIDSLKTEKIRLEAGLFVPLGSLSNKMGISKEFGIYYRLKMPHNDIADLGFKFYFPEDNKDFTYYDRDSTYTTRSKSFGLIALTKINKHFQINIFEKEYIVEYSSGIGFNFFLFDNKVMDESGWETNTDDDGNNSYKLNTDLKALMSPYFSQSIGVSRKQLGLSLQYNFMPFNWFSKRIEGGFGNSGASIVFIYKI